MSDLQDRFEQLARRGTPRGGDEVLAAARESVEHDAVTVVGMDTGGSRKRRHGGSLVAAAGVAATLFVCTLAFSALLGSGSGSDSPEGAVRQLADAVSNEDALAAADVLAPEEVRSLSQTVDSTARKAQELELARSAAAPLAGVDLSVDGLELSTETLADGYVKVTVSGGVISARTESDRLSPLLQRVVTADSATTAEADLSTLATDLPTFVVTVQRDGHWYVSAAYTALEYIRVANDLPPADFGSGVRATASLGADSPDAAVTGAMQALAASDWPALIALAPPDEIPVYDYRDALVQLGRDETVDFTIDRLETTSTITGDTAQVTLRAGGTTESGDWSIDGACFQPPINSTFSDGSPMIDTGDWCSTPFAYSVVPFLGMRPDVARTVQVSVVRNAGRWFVSPVGTVLDFVDQYVSRLTRRQLYSAIGVADQLPPDSTLTLGVPVAVTDPVEGASVFALEGRRGQRLFGVVSAPTGFDDDDDYPAYLLVAGPDGTVLGDSYDLIAGSGLRLPADGTYKLIVQPWVVGQTFTVWDETNAPESAKHPPFEGAYEGCRVERNGGTTCWGSSSSFSEPTEECKSMPDGSTECTSISSSSSSSSSSGSSDSGSTSATTMVPGVPESTSTTRPGG